MSSSAALLFLLPASKKSAPRPATVAQQLKKALGQPFGGVSEGQSLWVDQGLLDDTLTVHVRPSNEMFFLDDDGRRDRVALDVARTFKRSGYVLDLLLTGGGNVLEAGAVSPSGEVEWFEVADSNRRARSKDDRDWARGFAKSVGMTVQGRAYGKESNHELERFEDLLDQLPWWRVVSELKAREAGYPEVLLDQAPALGVVSELSEAKSFEVALKR